MYTCGRRWGCVGAIAHVSNHNLTTTAADQFELVCRHVNVAGRIGASAKCKLRSAIPFFQEEVTTNRADLSSLSFTTIMSLPYNCEFSLFELKKALSGSPDTSPGVMHHDTCCKMQHNRTVSGTATHQMAPSIRGMTEEPNAERRRLGHRKKNCVERERRRWKHLMAVQATPPK
ncbi:hypothetical protein AVEN_97640-1 [Araneus ventricosus]|uniref:Uncharacterized protein n=1 Tax=Araneus ventricosus TaxID=182803 RepID=A0A4Y2GZM2_ARAVE|nr:hypothetical protein AVEN_97640-1 [Araneus ventricosus]